MVFAGVTWFLVNVGSEGLLLRVREAAARMSYIDFILTALLAGLWAGVSAFVLVTIVDIERRSSRVGLPILEEWSLTKARGGV